MTQNSYNPLYSGSWFLNSYITPYSNCSAVSTLGNFFQDVFSRDNMSCNTLFREPYLQDVPRCQLKSVFI